jgi:hypothetical protein
MAEDIDELMIRGTASGSRYFAMMELAETLRGSILM